MWSGLNKIERKYCANWMLRGNKYGFLCSCPACVESSEASDRRRTWPRNFISWLKFSGTLWCDKHVHVASCGSVHVSTYAEYDVSLVYKCIYDGKMHIRMLVWNWYGLNRWTIGVLIPPRLESFKKCGRIEMVKFDKEIGIAPPKRTLESLVKQGKGNGLNGQWEVSCNVAVLCFVACLVWWVLNALFGPFQSVGSSDLHVSVLATDGQTPASDKSLNWQMISLKLMMNYVI